jgi:hypothetical protein
MMLEFHPEAYSEFLYAIEYYEDCEPGLGEAFSLEVFSAIQKIGAYPFVWPVLEKDVRRCLTNRFPYGVLYVIESNQIVILAIMHLHREPDYWKNRDP